MRFQFILGIITKIFGTFLAVVLTFLLGRIMGAQEFGSYSFAFAIISVLMIIAQFGLPVLVLRETAIALQANDGSTLIKLWVWCLGMAVGISFLTIMVGAQLGYFSETLRESQLGQTFYVGLILLGFVVTSRVLSGILRGMGFVVFSQLPEIIIRPFFLVSALLLSLFISADASYDATNVMKLHAFCAFAALLVTASFFWLKASRYFVGVGRSLKDLFAKQRYWVSSALPLGAFAIIQIILTKADIIILGIFQESRSVGIYRVSSQAAMLIPFGLQVANVIVAPQIARKYKENDLESLQRMLKLSVLISFAIAAVGTVILVLLGEYLLQEIVGIEFAEGKLPMIILSCGQLASVALGSTVVILNMTNLERTVALTGFAAAVLNILLNLLLVPTLGMNGAAFSTATALLVLNASLYYAIKKKVNLDSSIFSTIKRED